MATPTKKKETTKKKKDAAKEPAKKAVSAKPASAPAKKATAAKPAKKPAAKPAKKPEAKKAAAAKPAKTAAPAKKTAAKKTPAKKAAPSKAPAKTAAKTAASKKKAAPAVQPPVKAAVAAKPAAKAPATKAGGKVAPEPQAPRTGYSVHIGPRRSPLAVAPGAMVVGGNRRPERPKEAAPVEPGAEKRLSKRDLADIKERLIARQEMLLAAMKNELKVQRERSGAKAADEIDKATDAYDEDLSFEIATANDQELQELQIALDKIDKGTYGLCEGCRCPISASRLRVLPFATTCVSCRGQEELQRLHEEEGTTFNLLGDEPETDEPEA